MLKSLKNKRNLLFSIVFVFVCFFAYQYWVSAAVSGSQLNPVVGGVGDETLELLIELRTLVLDEDIFTDDAFQNLTDFSMELKLQPIGRNNPFSPVGSDGDYVGVGTNVVTATVCEDEACFEEKFAECEPAKIEVSLQGLGGVVDQSVLYKYEILGLKSGYCEVESSFIKNPNQDWIGKTMICRYDNSQKFDVVVKKMDSCSGELYNLMVE